MAVTTVQSNNKLVRYTKQINREFVRESMFSPYMGKDVNSIIRIRHELKNGGEQMNIPMVTKLRGGAIGSGTLTGNEEIIDNYGMRVWLDWARKAVKTNKAEKQKDSADIFGEAVPLLTDWGKELQRDECIEAFMALPSESAPAGLGSDAGQRVNGILYQSASTAELDAYTAANQDRILFGSSVSNFNATHGAALANVDTTNDKFTGSLAKQLKRLAENSEPKIRPYKTKDGYEHYVCFCGSNAFRDISNDLETMNQTARARERDGMKNNPLFMDGDLLIDGIIIRKVPEISKYVTNVWTSLITAGNSSSRVEPVFLCGQQAAVMAWGQMARPNNLDDTDYGFNKGQGIDMAYGVSKMFKKHPMGGSNLKQWGVVTGFVSAAVDS